MIKFGLVLIVVFAWLAYCFVTRYDSNDHLFGTHTREAMRMFSSAMPSR